jgi:uncharacterized protein (TIGR03437 family)
MFVLVSLMAGGIAQAQYISVSPTALNFSYTIGGSLPNYQTATLTSYTNSTLAAPGTSVAITGTTVTFLQPTYQNWLTAGTLGSTITTGTQVDFQLVPAVIASLPAGTYNATVQFSYDNTASPQSQNFVGVTLVVAAAAPAGETITTSVSSLIFTATAGGATPAGQTFSVSTSDNANVTASVTSVSPWLVILPPSGGTPLTISVYATPGTMAAGNYVGTIAINAPNASTQVAVFLSISASGGGGGGGTINQSETIAASPTSLSFSYNVGGSLPTAQSLAITTSDNTNFTATALTNDGHSWLNISPTSGATPGTISVSVSPSGLNSGNYSGTITINAPNSVVQVSVSFTVGGGGLSLSPTSLTFNIPQNYGFGASQTIQVTAAAATSFQAFGSSDNNWLVVDTPSGTTPGTVTVRANDSSLAQGSYSGMVTVQSGPSNATQVPVSLTVGAPATVQLSPSTFSFSYTIGNPIPAAQTVNVKSLTGSSQPFSVNATTTDGAAWLVATPTSPAPGSVAISINPGTLLPGSYTGVVNVLPSVTGASPQPVQVSLTVLPAPTPTVLSVDSSASYAAGTVAPGEFVTLFGTALGPAALTTPTPGTAPKTLGGTVVTFDGIPAPILYTSATQTGVQIPYGINLPQTVLQVQRNGATSASTNVNSVPAFPALFTSNASGQGQAAALNSDYSLNSASNPAARGTTIILYGTGEGKTNPTSVEGTITPGIQPLPQPLYPVTVSFAGITGTIAYVGETPTALAGLMQINVTIPPNAPVGPSVAVFVTINGQTSPGNVTVAIQ